MPDGSGRAFLPAPVAAEPRSRDRRTYALAAMVAVALHGTVLLPLLLRAPQAQPPDVVAAVELTPVADAAAALASPDQPVTESTTSTASPQPTKAIEATEAPLPPPPDATAAVKDTEVAPAPPPEQGQALASIEPPMADVPAELVQAAPPPPDAVIAKAPPLPLPPPPAPPTITPPPPRPVRPVPPRPPAKPAPRPEVARAAPSPSEATAPATAPATAGAAAPATAGAAAASPAAAPSMAALSQSSSPNAVPTWSGELSARLQRAKRYPDGARDRGDQGVATATFTMDRSGHVLSANLVRSSGSRALDEEALALIRRAEPLPPPPPEMPGAIITLTVPISFSLR